MKTKAAALLLSLLAAGELLAETPTFSKDVAPILYRNCVPCHHEGGAGPFSLIGYKNARRHASQIERLTQKRLMPPWLPTDDHGTFQDERRLTTEEIETIAAWVRARAPEDDLAQLPAEPAFSTGWQFGPPDIIVTASQPLRLAAAGPDVFWNFVFQTGLTQPRYVRAIEIRTGNNRLVHHANLLIDRVGSSLHLSTAESGGFPGMDLNLNRNPLDPESHFLFWKPGSSPYSEPDGLSWQLRPGNVLVLNTHLQPSGKPEIVTPSIGLYFTGKPPTQFPILVQLQNDRTLSIPAGNRDYVVTDTVRLPVATRLLAIYPHAHYLGTLLEGEALFPGGTRRTLIRIRHWDLGQQSVYRYKEPVVLPAGTVVSMRFHYDNSAANVRNPNTPPKRVKAGNAATDEMGHLWLQLLPEGKGDGRRPIQEAVLRHRAEEDPNDAAAHLNLGALLLSRLQAQAALTELRTAVRLDPDRAQGHDMLGAALQNTGQLIPAIAEFRAALRVQPDYMSAHYNLALALAKTGSLAESLRHLEIVAKAYPEDVRLQSESATLRARVKSESGSN